MAPDQPATAKGGHEPLSASPDTASAQVPGSAAQPARETPPGAVSATQPPGRAARPDAGAEVPGSAAQAAETGDAAGEDLAGSAPVAGPIENGHAPRSVAGGEVPGSAPDAETGTVPAAKASRAGRDLRSAIGVGLALGALVLVSLLTVRQIFIGVIAAAVAMATIELAGALKRSVGIQVALVPVLVGGQAMVWLSWPWGRDAVLASFVVTMFACLVWRFRGGSDGFLRDVSASIFTAAYVPLFAAFASLLVEPSDGAARVLCFLIAVVCSDTGGYAAGVLFGKHPMAPSISPKKSWEGFAGSLVVGVIGGALSVQLLLHSHWWLGVPFGAALVICATGGDLVESLIKRDLGIKDMGNLLPGHGGVMDRMDSLLPSAVAAWLLLTLLVPN
jgi:phosphatidate cytidylyltransferase